MSTSIGSNRRTQRRRLRRTRDRLLALAGVGSLLGAVVPAALAAPSATAAGEPACRLVELKKPKASPWGTVTDIEVVDGAPTYYGTFDRKHRDGEWHPQAVVWRGLGGDPVRVGPKGTDGTVAFELTRSGLVNGMSENWETGNARFWVQDLATGRLRWFRTNLDGRPSDGDYIRRINNKGAATGEITAAGEDFGDAVGYRAGSSEPFRLPVPRRAMGSSALGINDLGQRAGFWAKPTDDPDIGVFQPTVWEKDGTRHRLEILGFDADARNINNAGQVFGGTWFGTIQDGHYEATFWGAHDDAVALGLLPDGGGSVGYGMDRAGRVVGWADHLGDPEHPMVDPGSGTLWHNYFWTPEMGEGTVRVLPSLYSVGTDENDWREWHSTHAAHAGNARLDQIGAGTHAGFAEDGTPIGAPTVFVNASRCGVDVETTHEAFWDDPAGARRVPESHRAGREAMGGS